MNKTRKIKIYYFILIGIIGFKVITTIFQVGLSAHHGSKIAQLKLQQNNIAQEKLRLTTQLAEKSSISQIVSDQDLTQYQSISDTIVITVNNEVASR